MYALIRKWEQSGLPQAKFFSEHKISKSTFGYWRRKYLREQVQIKTQGKMVPIHILAPDAGLVAIYEITNGKGSLYYIHKDYLGSIQCISNEQGQAVEHLSFDPWGNRRNPNDWSIDYDPQEPLFDRGFTGHQHLDDFHLINMNGRVYDPILAQFLSPDNYVSAPESSQGLNRYIYCYNNPLVYTDPDGQVPWLALGIVAAYTYLSNAHANRDPETGKWAWNPATWFGSNSNTTITAGISTNGNSVTGYGGIGTGNNFPVFGYNNQNGAGVGLWSPEGTTGFYYPNIDYDAGAKAVDPMINNVRNEYFSQVNGLNNFYIDIAPRGGYTITEDGHFADKNGKPAQAYTDYLGDGLSDVYLSPASHTDAFTLYIALGHEMIHVAHYNKFQNNFLLGSSEYYAYKWSHYVFDGFYGKGSDKVYLKEMGRLFMSNRIIKSYDYENFGFSTGTKNLNSLWDW